MNGIDYKDGISESDWEMTRNKLILTLFYQIFCSLLTAVTLPNHFIDNRLSGLNTTDLLTETDELTMNTAASSTFESSSFPQGLLSRSLYGYTNKLSRMQLDRRKEQS